MRWRHFKPRRRRTTLSPPRSLAGLVIATVEPAAEPAAEHVAAEPVAAELQTTAACWVAAQSGQHGPSGCLVFRHFSHFRGPFGGRPAFRSGACTERFGVGATIVEAGASVAPVHYENLGPHQLVKVLTRFEFCGPRLGHAVLHPETETLRNGAPLVQLVHRSWHDPQNSSCGTGVVYGCGLPC